MISTSLLASSIITVVIFALFFILFFESKPEASALTQINTQNNKPVQDIRPQIDTKN